MQEWCGGHFPSFIDKDCGPINSPNLNPLDYFVWDEMINAIDWDKVRSKTTLIQQLKLSVKKALKSVMIKSWTNRLYRISESDGNYLR